MGWFTGTVVEIIPNAYMGYDRRCVYTEDGDVEDLRIKDLVELAKLDDQSQNDCNVKGRQSPLATSHHKASSSAKKSQCKIKTSKYSGMSTSQREKVAMAKLASYLEECGGMFQCHFIVLLSKFLLVLMLLVNTMMNFLTTFYVILPSRDEKTK
jgi:hypothetical protein